MAKKPSSREQRDLRQLMGSAVLLALQTVEKGMTQPKNWAKASKEVAFGEVLKLKRFKELSSENGFTFTGDNWQDHSEQSSVSVAPYLTASIALTKRDKAGTIVAVAMAPVHNWNGQILIADGEGVWIGRPQSGSFHLVQEVNEAWLGLSPTLQIFGQKQTPYWVAVNGVVGDLAKAGIRATNDCGPYFGLVGWFSGHKSGTIVPRNMAYCEPYATKQKEEIMPFVIRALNRSLPKGQRFVITDLGGNPLFEGRRTKRAGTDEKYGGAGYLISPGQEAHEQILEALRNSVLNRSEFTGAEAGSKMRLFAEQLNVGFPDVQLVPSESMQTTLH